MNDLVLLAKAWNFAAGKHAHQVRKGSMREAHVNHLSEVAELVAEATDGADANLIAAAILHDVIEDTFTSSYELAEQFNQGIADLVAEVSDDKFLEVNVRKRLQIESAPAKSTRAKILMLADKTSNLRSLLNGAAVDWTAERKTDYCIRR